ncbi:MAG: hypothetical protein AcusKO_23690 [Acuticoccus sp.]
MNPPDKPPELPPPARRAAVTGDARAVLSAAGPIFFLPPVLALADRDVTVFGVPLLAAYIFFVWLAGIVLIALSARRDRAD